MPTLVSLAGLDSLTSGTNITTSNTTPTLVGVSKGTNSTVTADSATVPSGFTGNGVKIGWDANAGAGDIRMTLPSTGQSASNVYRESFYYRTTNTTPGADITLLQLNATLRAFTLTQRSSTAGFRILDSTNAALDLSGTYAWNTWYRIEIQADNTSGVGASKLIISVYNMAGTLVGTYSNTSTANLATGQFNQWRHGASGYNATPGNHGFYALRWSDGGTGEVGAFAPPLSTPTVTLGATTNPTTIGGTNGSQVVTWAGVSNATAYDAYLATNGSPQQSDFSLVASSVSSPYTFTSLGAGTLSFGIQAKP